MKILSHSDFKTVFPRAKPFVPEIGDLLGAKDFFFTTHVLAGLRPSNYKVTEVSMRKDPWELIAAKNSGVIRRQVSYECPWRQTQFYHFVPVYLVAKGKPTEDPRTQLRFYRDFLLRDKDAPPPTSAATWLGHGYTDGTLPSDGSGEFTLATLLLNNGDIAIGWLWVWFNK